MNSSYSRSGGRGGAENNQGNGTNGQRKTFRSKMTDAYSITDLGEELPGKDTHEYFEDTAIHLLSEINVLMEKIIHLYFAPLGLTYVQIPILMTLLKQGAMTVSQLGRTLEIGSSNITPLCKRLESAGLVKRTRDTVDQRVVYVSITDYARDLLNRANLAIKETTGVDVNPLTAEDETLIERGLVSLREYLGSIVASTEKHQMVSKQEDKRRARLEAARVATEQSMEQRRKQSRQELPEDQENRAD